MFQELIRVEPTQLESFMCSGIVEFCLGILDSGFLEGENEKHLAMACELRTDLGFQRLKT